MSIRVVCISRTIAAGGEAVGQAVAHRLGFRYIDEQIIEKAAQQAQVDPALVAAAEHRQPLLQRFLDKLARGADLAGTVTLATGVPLDVFVPSPTAYRAEPEDLRVLIRAAIHEVARTGNVVIVAHAASFALSGAEGLLRVLVTASAETRAQRLALAQSSAAADAAKAVAASDRERREYLYGFYKVTEELPTHYDLVINTDALTPAQAVETILAAAQPPA
ncbi:MAG TPA: cytidylate kinase-like family protein [Candidatus Margulisiibacteriota bacterium]|nr:cytidylate kinase-like family protein [Candidatus Margulisiibacteriota bacterium]